MAIKNIEITALKLGKRIKSLRVIAGLSVEGLAFAADISINHIRKIEAGNSNLTSKTAEKISNFFEMTVEELYSFNAPISDDLKEIPTIKKFYLENTSNPKFFIERKRENSITNFLKTKLLPTVFFEEFKGVKQVTNYSKEEFGRHFDSKEVSRCLNRMVKSGLLIKEDKTGTGSVFIYKKP